MTTCLSHCLKKLAEVLSLVHSSQCCMVCFLNSVLDCVDQWLTVFIGRVCVLLEEVGENQMSSHECSQCSKSFVNETLLQRHVASACSWPDEQGLDSRSCIFPTSVKSVGSTTQLQRHLQSDSLSTCAPVHISKSMAAHRSANGDSSGRSQHKQINERLQFSSQKNDQNVEMFQCYICERSYDDRIKLQRHLCYHKNRRHKTLYCSRCSQSFANVNSLRRHENIHRRIDARKKPASENVRRIYECSRCERTFDCLHMLARHERNHTDHDKRKQNKHRVHRCSRCSRSFSTSAEVNNHEMSCAAKKDHICPFCNKCFLHQALWYRHIEQMHCNEDLSKIGPVYTCSNCNLIFLEADRLRDHERRTHNQPMDNVYICSQCSKSFKTRAGLTSHLYTHTGERPYPCRAGCNRRFAQTSTRTFHERTHSEARPYICSVCGAAFKHSTMLRLHSRVHTGIRPHKCPSCPRTFARCSQLIGHVRVHTRECPYVCSTCSRQFKTQSTLVRHERGVHHQLKPWQCSVCDKTFTQPANLRVHMRVHTREKPFVCSYCDLQFTYATTLKSHMRVHEQR